MKRRKPISRSRRSPKPARSQAKAGKQRLELPKPDSVDVCAKFPPLSTGSAVAFSLESLISQGRSAPRRGRVRAPHIAKTVAAAGRKLTTARSHRLMQGCATGAAVFTIAGCSVFQPGTPSATATRSPEPLLRIQGNQLTAAQAYAMGKASLAVADLQRALLHFEKALALQPLWADAENGRLVSLARLGRADEAVAGGQRAVALGVHSAELHGNLGLLLDERGDSRRAAIHFARAAQLDPDNPAWQRWTVAAAVAAPVAAPAKTVVAPPVTPVPAQAVSTVSQGQAPSTSAQPAPVVTLAGASRLSQVPLASATSQPEPVISTRVEVENLRWVQQAPNVLLLAAAPQTRTAGAHTAQAVPSAAPPSIVVLGPPLPSTTPPVRPTVAAAPISVPPVATSIVPTPATVLQASLTVLSRIEISNGHGRNGLARDIANGLQAVMSGPARVTNHTHFRVLQTEVQYRTPEELGAAKTLARSLGVPEERIVLNSRLRESAPVRLLLGRDAPDTQESITDTLARARRSIQG